MSLKRKRASDMSSDSKTVDDNIRSKINTNLSENEVKLTNSEDTVQSRSVSSSLCTKNINTIKLLPVATRREWTRMIKYCEEGNLHTLKAFFNRYDCSDIINVWEGNGRLCLLLASREGHVDIVKLLLDKGADVNGQSDYRDTALMFASCNGFEDIVQLLLDKGADVNIQDKEGNTALIVASCNGHANIIRLLIDKGADVNIQDKEGNTALIVASCNGHANIIRLLIDKGADINLLTNDGSNALIFACDCGDIDTVKILVENDADMNIVNDDGYTAYSISETIYMKQYLQEATDRNKDYVLK